MVLLRIWVKTYLFCFLPLLLDRGVCFTHWTVTDDGLSIQPVSDSPYYMVQSHSLVQFLDQEKKLDAIARMRGLVSEHEKNIHVHENADDPELETKIRTTDKDCIMGEFVSSNKDVFFTAYTLGKLVEDLEVLANIEFNKDNINSENEPHCKYDLPFSVHAFEHFLSVGQRHTLKINPESSFQKSLPSNYETTEFGSHIAKALEKEPTNSSFLRLAALYWRIKGDAPKAVECFRRALHFTTKKMRFRTWFDFGNLLHRAGYPLDAIVLYELASLGMNDATVHMALADAYALIQNRTKAIDHYNIAFSMDPSMKTAQIKAAALKCDQKLITAMEKQHKNLLNTIEEKNLYNDRYETIKDMEESVEKNVADLEDRMQSSLIYDYFTYGSLPYSSCRSVSLSGYLSLQCSVSDWRRYQTAREDRYRKLLANIKRSGAKNISKPAVSVMEDFTDSAELVAFLKNLETIRGMDRDEPTDKPIYPQKLTPSTKELLEYYVDDNWPDSTSCETDRWRYPLPTVDNLPQLFLSPKNKGFRPSELLSKYLGLNVSQEHPLPWHPPNCGIYLPKKPLSTIFQLSAVRTAAVQGHSLNYAENNLGTEFLGLIEDKITEADIAQRIGTLMKYSIGPQWLVFNMAALYWRIVGAPGEAITCLHAALEAQPERYADVALVQLAQVVIRSGINDESDLNDVVALVNKALQIDSNEPITLFLMGIVKILQRKLVSGLKYIRAAVVVDPLFQPAVSVFHALKCLNKNGQGMMGGDQLHLRCCSQDEPNVYCFGVHEDRCFIALKKRVFVGTTCISNSKKRKDSCTRAFSFAPFVAPVDLVEGTEDEKKMHEPVVKSTKNVHKKPSIDTSDEIPLDYGAQETLQRINKMTVPSTKNFFQSEIRFVENDMPKEEVMIESWEEDILVDEITVPEKPLTLAHVPERRKMISYDIPLPSILPLPSKKQINNGFIHVPLPVSRTSNSDFCANAKMSLTMLREQSTSTWLSVTAKGVNLEKFIDFQAPVNLKGDFEPICSDTISSSPVLTLDHLPAYHLRHQFIHYKPEKALTDAFLKLGKEKKRVEVVAKRLKDAMVLSLAYNKDKVHWSLSTASALYWRVKGDAVNAIKCLRQSLNSAPPEMRDVALISMANIYQQAGLLHSALIVGGSALTISPKLVAIHFTLANIYASLGKYQHALMLYYSTLSMQSNFEPAKERIRAIYCFTGEQLIDS
ncbi:unnamed protein product [Thelazia callipaeda]|uniref:TPR_REGION domain-containing protein n=1 Tax=Thelazia callipaeda TaxID=103827 RepID=A0A158RD00_THECL|nr:unnamed protein product [Thelazia callipaeda]